MERAKTVFILGAGAGNDIEMPVGQQLIAQIIGRLSNDDVTPTDKLIRAAFEVESKKKQIDPSQYWRGCGALAKGLPGARSVDDYLHAHSNDTVVQLVGKLAIARCILHSENGSLLSEKDGPLRIGTIAKSWLMPFFHLLRDGIQQGSEEQVFEGVAVINFNYDRCLEQFFYYALQQYYGVEAKRAAEVMDKFAVYHPYGSIGPLPWQNEGTKFGDGEYIEALQSASRRLRTFNEEAEYESVELVGSVIAAAETLIFLGFHFHSQNMELLQPKQSVSRIYATVMNRSGDEQDIIHAQLLSFIREDLVKGIKLTGNSCRGAFEEFGLSWAKHRR